MPPQQSHGLLDRLDQLFGFGAHDPTHKPEGKVRLQESLSLPLSIVRRRRDAARMSGKGVLLVASENSAAQ
jgi:hypothetical protein